MILIALELNLLIRLSFILDRHALLEFYNKGQTRDYSILTIVKCDLYMNSGLLAAARALPPTLPLSPRASGTRDQRTGTPFFTYYCTSTSNRDRVPSAPRRSLFRNA